MNHFTITLAVGALEREREREAKAIPSIISYINQIQESMSGSITVSNTKEKHPQYVSAVKLMFEDEEISGSVPEICNTKDFYSDLIRAHLKPQTILRGRVSCLLSITPAINNVYRSVHGGAVASIAEIVSIACARTVVAESKELFLGELSISYLSGAQTNAEVLVDGSVVRSGRNLTVVAVEFKLNKTEQLIYTARATFYHMPIAKL